MMVRNQSMAVSISRALTAYSQRTAGRGQRCPSLCWTRPIEAMGRTAQGRPGELTETAYVIILGGVNMYP